MRFFQRTRKISLVKARRKMYKQLSAKAAKGDIRAMYHLAKLFYREKDKRYYSTIFKWVNVLSTKTKDPSVWMMLGDLFFFGCGTKKNWEKALECYEKSLSEAIVLGKDTPLSLEMHTYVEKQILRLRKASSEKTN